MDTRSFIDRAFTSLVIEAGRHRDDIELGAWDRHVRTLDEALKRFCAALDDANASPSSLDRRARDAFMAVLAVAQLVAGAHSVDPRTAGTLEVIGLTLRELLDAFEPYVTAGDREARRVLLDGEPLDAVLERMFCG